MGGISQNLKAVITFGGNLDNSWKRSADGLQKSLKDVGKQSERLTKDQTKLAAEIKRAKLAGESLGDLKRRYTDVSREIRKTEAEQQKLNVQMQKAQRIQAFKGAGKGLFRRGLGIAGQVTDYVTVKSATIANYAVTAELEIPEGPDASTVLNNAIDVLRSYTTLSHRIKTVVPLSAIYAALQQSGVVRVRLISPVADLEAEPGKAPWCTVINVTRREVSSNDG
ncbi:hypothetical protein QDQ61_23590 [Citrobacter freundii]|nr:hypothetical protein [Citrobacter freundii]AYL56255.1 hypothetical protein CUC48_06515 [Citrobacter freundii]OUE61488.1 hypothetical protein AZ002_003703 [Citrobacter freundii]TYS01089.1 hypothetical protein FYK57_18895 [Citrobacter freundii]HAT7581496.1 hypothetical protein [Citrobacter freundii]